MTENGQKYHPLHDDQQTTTDQQAPVDGPMGVWATLGALANRIRAITGRSTFRDNPPTNLTEAKTHHDATGNVHNLTRAQLGAAAATDLDSHKADQQNPHAVSAAQAGAPPTSRTISTTAPLSGGGNLSANRTLSISPASTSAAGSMSASDKAKLDGLDSSSYAPASHVGSGGAAHANASASVAGFLSGADKAKLNELVTVGPGLSGNGRGATPLGLRVYGFTKANRAGAGDQAIVYNTDVKVNLTNVVESTTNSFANGRFTAPISGRYTLVAATRWAGLRVVNVLAVWITKNGSRVDGEELYAQSPGSVFATAGGPAYISLNAGDYVELWVRVSGNGDTTGSPVLGGSGTVGSDAMSYMAIGYWGAL